MHGIEASEGSASLKQDWESIFSSPDPFRIPFVDSITAYLILYPTAGYHLSEAQYFAIVEAARLVGDEEFLVSETEWQSVGFSAASHWRCAFSTYREYKELPLVLENAIYSPRSQWGLLVSHEDHAIVGGTLQFIEQVKLLYPNWALDIERLRQAWAGHPEAGWVDALLQQVLV